MEQNIKNLLLSALLLVGSVAVNAENPKREFRGAWMHTVHQSQYAEMSTDETKAYLIKQLDQLKKAGMNAIVFQVRPSADAFYPSDLEPWSRFLSGEAGEAPYPFWDPLQFMIEECHKRGMELHAWLNPYRVTTTSKEKLPKNHIYSQHPERFLRYDGKLYFDPALEENRKFIEDVVKDIITRYDVDAIHMDDYFYPYPVKNKEFPDKNSYNKYGNGMDRGDWRRKNVDMLIEGLHNVIAETKPWVRLGISPFGIWRNKKTDPRGSDTNGLQNYDALYADVLLWTKNGWVDYMVPQLYWTLQSKAASSEKLAYWWNDNANGRDMYIGQAVRVTMDNKDINGGTDPNQLKHKVELSRELPNIQGNCWWPCYDVTSNYKGVADSLMTDEQSTIALPPTYKWIDDKAPKDLKKVKVEKKDGKKILTWKPIETDDKMQEARFYVVYEFADGEDIDLSNVNAIKSMSSETHYELPDNLKGKYNFVVTVLDRCGNESGKGKKVKVKF